MSFEKFFKDWCEEKRLDGSTDTPEIYRDWIEEAYRAGKEDEEIEDGELYIDMDGYVCFKDTGGLDGPGIWWTLHSDGWEAYINDGSDEPIYSTNEVTRPTDDEMGEAAQEYEEATKGG